MKVNFFRKNIYAVEDELKNSVGKTFYCYMLNMTKDNSSIKFLLKPTEFKVESLKSISSSYRAIHRLELSTMKNGKKIKFKAPYSYGVFFDNKNECIEAFNDIINNCKNHICKIIKNYNEAKEELEKLLQ